MSSSIGLVANPTGLSIIDNSTRYVAFCSNLGNSSATESDVQVPVRDAGVCKNLFTYSPTNTASVNSTITLRISLVSSALTVTYAADQTGIKEDQTNTPSVTATDELDYTIVIPAEAGTNNLTLTIIACEFVPTTTGNCISFLVTSGNPAFSTASVTQFMIPAGLISFTGTEANTKVRIRDTFTASNFWTIVSANARTTDTVFGTRKNGVTGGQSVTYTSTQTGAKEDISGTDSLVAGDDYCYRITTLTGTQTISPKTLSSRLLNTSSNFLCIAGNSAGIAQSFNVTNFFSIAGNLNANTAEAQASFYPRITFTAKELISNVTANTITTSNTVLTVRDNLADSSITISYAPVETGQKNDAANTATITTGTDEISYKLVTPNTSGSITFRYIGILGNAATGTTFFFTLAPVAVAPATLAKVPIFVLSAAAVAIGATTLSRIATFVKTIATTAIGVATAIRQQFVTMTSVAVGAAALTKIATFPKTVAATAIGATTLALAFVFGITVTTVAIGTATLSKVPTFVKTITATAIGTATLATIKTLFITIAATVIGVTTLVRQQFATLTAVAIGSSTLAKIATFPKTLASTTIGVATLALIEVIGLSISAVAIGVTTLTRVHTFVKTLTSIASVIAILNRANVLSITMSALASGLPTLLRKQFITISTTAIGILTLGRTAIFSKVLASVNNSLASLSRVFIPATPAADYYISPTGSDSNPGTEALPFLTFTKANSVVTPGKTVLVENGTYTSPGTQDSVCNFTVSGTAGNYITYKARNYLGAIIDGGGIDKYGFRINAAYIKLDGFDVTNQANEAGTGGILINGGNDWVYHCRMRDTGNFCTDSAFGMDGMETQAANFIVERCVFFNIGRYRPGESGCTPGNTFYRNHDHGIYVRGGSDGGIIRNNIFYNNDNGWSMQIYPDPITGLKVLNNTFADPNPDRVGHIIVNAALTNCDFANNISYNPTTAFINTDTATATNVTVRNNLTNVANITSTSPAGITLSGNIVNTNPGFVDAANRNYHLITNSAAKDAGLTLSDVTNDFDSISRPQGVAYDIGAFEFVGTILLVLAAVATSIASQIRKQFIAVNVTAIGTPTIIQLRMFLQSFTVTANCAVSLAFTKVKGFTMNAIATGTVTLSRVVTLIQTFIVTAIGIVSLAKTTTVFITMASITTNIATLVRKQFITMTLVSTSIITFMTARFALVVTTATAVGVVTLSRALVFAKSLSATAIGIVTLVVQFISGGVIPGSIYEWFRMWRRSSKRRRRR